MSLLGNNFGRLCTCTQHIWPEDNPLDSLVRPRQKLDAFNTWHFRTAVTTMILTSSAPRSGRRSSASSLISYHMCMYFNSLWSQYYELVHSFIYFVQSLCPYVRWPVCPLFLKKKEKNQKKRKRKLDSFIFFDFNHVTLSCIDQLAIQISGYHHLGQQKGHLSILSIQHRRISEFRDQYNLSSNILLVFHFSYRLLRKNCVYKNFHCILPPLPRKH